MARFNANDAENYGGSGGGGFFSLKNDMDTARIRIMYNTIDDVEGVSVHEVDVNGKKRYVNCLREYTDPMDVCPFCRERMSVQAKLFIPVYDVKEDKVKIWERGKTFFSKISGLCSRYEPLVETEFDVERHGKAKDSKTTYEFYPCTKAEKLSMEDLPEIPEDFDRFVLDKTADDMEYYLESGEFPPEEDDEEEEAPRRRGRRDEEDDEEEREERPRRESRDRESRQNSRRTPANRRRGGRDDAY